MKNASVIRALEATVELAKKDPWWTQKSGCTVEHLESMLKRMQEDKTMSPAKANRWLGWAQAIVCCWSGKEYQLDDFKKINKRHLAKDRKRDKKRASKLGKGKGS